MSVKSLSKFCIMFVCQFLPEDLRISKVARGVGLCAAVLRSGSAGTGCLSGSLAWRLSALYARALGTSHQPSDLDHAKGRVHCGDTVVIVILCYDG
jgi:hypothetical protein